MNTKIQLKNLKPGDIVQLTAYGFNYTVTVISVHKRGSRVRREGIEGSYISSDGDTLTGYFETPVIKQKLK